MLVLEWQAAARADLLSIIDYIADDNPDAAQRVKDDIEAKVAALPRNFDLYRAGRVAGTREMLVRDNYIVIYRRTEQTISIMRVLHAARQWP